ncbi:MAG: DUF2163 domain-containing protein [Alphaproteobacteria bacterium]|jgi:uncharacterized phage protein (TIGR02218 family)|nr:DUF2163 domain-containing protein [Alphaproteobacteria bacterium]
MKSATTQLAVHIAGETTTLATCWKVTRKDGAVFGFTDFDRDLVIDDVMYEARTGYTRSAIQTISDLSVDNLDIESAFDSEAITAADLRSGYWDNAEVLIFLVNWAALSQGKIVLKRGTIGQVEMKDTFFKAELRGLTQALSQQIGELYTPNCRADLGDARCKVDLAALTVASAVTTATDRYGFTDTARTEADDYWIGGLITWTSGANVGRKMEIRSFAAGVFELFLPMPSEIAVGDGYTVQPGCDKAFSTCCTKYNNAVNFRGEPHVPGTDAVLSYPDGK